jgi:hypothetical protein
MRSLTLCAGLKDSNLATTSAAAPSVTRFRRTSGVLPTSWVMSSAIRVVCVSSAILVVIVLISNVFESHLER